MKYTKKLLSLVLVLVLALALAVPGFAAEVNSGLGKEGSVTLNGTVSGKSYEFYRVFDLTYSGSGDDTNVSYTINSAWTNFFNGAGAKYISNTNTGNLSSIIIGGQTKYINITDAAAFAEDALAYAMTATAAYTLNATDTTMKVTGLPLGYYLIYPVGATEVLEDYASICSLTNTLPDATANVKSDYPDVDKTVSNSDYEVEIGQIVPYTITGQVPSTEGYEHYYYQVSDYMDEDLRFDKNVVLKIDGQNIEITGNSNVILEYYDAEDVTDPIAHENGFVLRIDMSAYQDNKFDTFTIEYSATVTEDAVVEMGNHYELVGGPNPDDFFAPVEKPPVNVYTCKVVIDKYDGATNAKLADAKFILYKMDNEAKKYYKYENNVVSWVDDEKDATVVTTDSNGAAEFKGIQSGTYYVHETEAPKGYNIATEDVEVEVSSNSTSTELSTGTARVANNTGTVLPGTGGMGTTIFYTLGGVLVVGAAILLVTKKRVHDVEG